MANLKESLMKMGYTEEQAEAEIRRGRNQLNERLERGEMPFDLCQKLWGLEPDYLDDLMY